MENTLPFFYYDILSRIMPGAVALAVIWSRPDSTPVWLACSLASNNAEWLEKLAVPVVLAGLCYMIGVLYEVIDYWYPMLWITKTIEKLGFYTASRTFEGDKTNLSTKSAKELTSFRDELWRELEYTGSTDPNMSPMFAHCHRFQAEQKMFLHLFYPSMLFISLCFVDKRPYSVIGAGVFAVILFLCASFSRSRRRWLQALVFGHRSNLPVFEANEPK